MVLKGRGTFPFFFFLVFMFLDVIKLLSVIGKHLLRRLCGADSTTFSCLPVLIYDVHSLQSVEAAANT
jgi:hypothetical protein